MNFIDLLALVVRNTKPDHGKFVRPETLDTPLSEEATGLDSLDMALVITVMGEIYKVPMEVIDRARGIETVADLQAFVEANGTRWPDSLDEAAGYIE